MPQPPTSESPMHPPSIVAVVVGWLVAGSCWRCLFNFCSSCWGWGDGIKGARNISRLRV